MEDSEDIKEFPDIGQKLAAKKAPSARERERKEAEAKQERAKLEDAAALAEFEASFAAEDDDSDFGQARTRGPSGGARGSYGGFRGGDDRFGGRGGSFRGGYGGYGAPAPGLPGPPPSLKKRRALDELREAQQLARRGQDALMPYHSSSDNLPAEKSTVQPEPEEESAPRPTVELSSLPARTTSRQIEKLLDGRLVIHKIHFLVDPPNTGKRTRTAIVTLAEDTTTTQIDTAVAALKDRYLGSGQYLQMSRHLPSTALHPSLSSAATISKAIPFGAEKPRESDEGRQSMRNAPPPEHFRDRPSDIGSRYNRQHQGGNGGGAQDLLADVSVPSDIATIRAIHTVAECLLAEADADEALLMERSLMELPEVQQDERFAFLFDSTSPAGLYYRYILWGEDATRGGQRQRLREPEKIFSDVPIGFRAPADGSRPFPDLCSLEQVIDDSDYYTSAEESDDEEAEQAMPDADVKRDPFERRHLTPLRRARLAHLLARLPTTNPRLRRGDVARVTHFAINHAGSGAEEIVEMLLFNVARPLSLDTAAAKYDDSSAEESSVEDDYEPEETLPSVETLAGEDTIAPTLTNNPRKRPEKDDGSNAKLVALYIISDILSASSTAGARNAWKYRTLFEAGFQACKTFEHLGRLERELGWGRIKAEQWKRKVLAVFGIWESWTIFPSEVEERLKRDFLEPPLTEEEAIKERQTKFWNAMLKRREGAQAKRQKRDYVPAAGTAGLVATNGGDDNMNDVDGMPLDDVDGVPLDVDGEPMDDVDGEPLDVDGVPLDDVDGQPLDDIDGEPMDDGDGGVDDGKPNDEMDSRATIHTSETGILSEPPVLGTGPVTPNPVQTTSSSDVKPPSTAKRRMRAEDMFASDEDEA